MNFSVFRALKMSLTPTRKTIFVACLLGFTVTQAAPLKTVDTGEYLRTLKIMAQLEMTIEEAIEIQAEGALYGNRWTSIQDMQSQLEQLEQALSIENWNYIDRLNTFRQVKRWGTKQTQEAYNLLDSGQVKGINQQKQFMDMLVKTNLILSHFKQEALNEPEWLKELERLLEINNHALLEALVETPVPEVLDRSPLWAKAIDAYHSEFELNLKVDRPHNSYGRLLKAHELRFPSFKQAILRGIGKTVLPLRVANGYQEAIVHMAIILGVHRPLVNLDLVVNAETRDIYLTQFLNGLHNSEFCESLFRGP